MVEINSPQARLCLRAHEATPARLEVVRRTRQVRLTRAALALLGFWALAPVVFFLPPHLPWALASVLAGIYFAYRQWTGEYEVRAFAGACPRCGNALAIPAGARIGLPHPMHCYACQHQPTLEVG